MRKRNSLLAVCEGIDRRNCGLSGQAVQSQDQITPGHVLVRGEGGRPPGPAVPMSCPAIPTPPMWPPGPRSA